MRKFHAHKRSIEREIRCAAMVNEGSLCLIVDGSHYFSCCGQCGLCSTLRSHGRKKLSTHCVTVRTVCSSSTWNPMEPYSVLLWSTQHHTAAQQQSRDDCKNQTLPTNLCLLFPFLHTHQHNNKTECILPHNS